MKWSSTKQLKWQIVNVKDRVFVYILQRLSTLPPPLMRSIEKCMIRVLCRVRGQEKVYDIPIPPLLLLESR